jgi:N-acetylglucosaminyldiphosphoundecaprenol N-acetyl-beta-D-mannosaminyltransferase
MYKKINIRGILFDSVTMDEAERICGDFLCEKSGGARVIHTPNAETVQLCVEHNEYYGLINSADLIIADGAGVILASKLLKKPLEKGKVAGIELCERLIAKAAREGRGVYFLGGKPGVAETAASKLKEKYPALIVSGTHNGYFNKVDDMKKASEYEKNNGAGYNDDAAVIEKINDSGAEILLVCLGVPKQEIWMHAHRSELKVRLMGGFGGSFDIFAGVSRRAPRVFIRLNLEWLYRLICEPRRLGRMMKLPRFIAGSIFSGLSKDTKNRINL